MNGEFITDTVVYLGCRFMNHLFGNDATEEMKTERNSGRAAPRRTYCQARSSSTIVWWTSLSKNESYTDKQLCRRPSRAVVTILPCLACSCLAFCLLPCLVLSHLVLSCLASPCLLPYLVLIIMSSLIACSAIETRAMPKYRDNEFVETDTRFAASIKTVFLGHKFAPQPARWPGFCWRRYNPGEMMHGKHAPLINTI